MLDGQEIGETVVDLVRGFLEREVAPLRAENENLKQRIAVLEERQPEKGEPGSDGVSPEPQEIIAACRDVLDETIKKMVDHAMSELPAPEPGPPGEKGEPGEKGMDGQDGALGADGKDGADGVGLAGALIDRAGHLRVCMTNGTDHDLGPVVGKDGDPGKDGHDGFGFEDLDVAVLDDDRTIEFSFRRGDEEKCFTLKWPTVLDRGPYKAEREIPYEPGDGVTYAGQFFICNEQTNAKPDESKDGKPWRLAVRKGRDGKDGK